MTEQTEETRRPALTVEEPSVPDLTGWMARRDTVRLFDPEAEIPDDEMRQIIDAGRKAPTSGALQMYSFVWIRDPDRRARIKELCGGDQAKVEECSHFFLVCIDLRRIRLLNERRDLPFELSPMSALLKGTGDAAMAAHGVLTVAESRGYGVCPIGAITDGLADVAAEADLPAEVLPVFGLCIGVPRGERRKPSTPRMPLDVVLHDGGYRDPSPEQLDECYDVMDERYTPESGRTWEDSQARWWTPRPDGWMNVREDRLLEAMRQQGFFAYCAVDEAVTPPTARE